MLTWLEIQIVFLMQRLMFRRPTLPDSIEVSVQDLLGCRGSPSEASSCCLFLVFVLKIDSDSQFSLYESKGDKKQISVYV